jgi:hypothetical protein
VPTNLLYLVEGLNEGFKLGSPAPNLLYEILNISIEDATTEVVAAEEKKEK